MVLATTERAYATICGPGTIARHSQAISATARATAQAAAPASTALATAIQAGLASTVQHLSTAPATAQDTARATMRHAPVTWALRDQTAAARIASTTALDMVPAQQTAPALATRTIMEQTALCGS